MMTNQTCLDVGTGLACLKKTAVSLRVPLSHKAARQGGAN